MQKEYFVAQTIPYVLYTLGGIFWTHNTFLIILQMCFGCRSAMTRQHQGPPESPPPCTRSQHHVHNSGAISLIKCPGR